MAKIIHHIKKHIKNLNKDIANEMLKLATGGFGLVAALAWNEVIKEVVNDYIKPVVGGNSGIISLAIYAVVITLLAVFVTYTLTKIVKRG